MLTIEKVLLTGVLAALAGGQAWAVTSITTCPFTISTPGNYVVATNLLCNGDGIHIDASNVTVNLNGHTIQSLAGVGGNYGIFVNYAKVGTPPPSRLDHVGISGPGLIQGFTFGIFLQESDYSQVSLTTVTGYSVGGIFASDVNYLTVGGNLIARNAGNELEGPLGPAMPISVGLYLGQSTGAQVTGNQAVANNWGIWLRGGDSNSLSGNVASGNAGSGIVLGAGVMFPLTNSRVSSNTTNGNGQSGIQVLGLLAGSFGNEIFNNLSAAGNEVFDLEDDNGPAPLPPPPPCGTDYWRNNVHFTTNQACVN